MTRRTVLEALAAVEAARAAVDTARATGGDVARALVDLALAYRRAREVEAAWALALLVGAEEEGS